MGGGFCIYPLNFTLKKHGNPKDDKMVIFAKSFLVDRYANACLPLFFFFLALSQKYVLSKRKISNES